MKHTARYFSLPRPILSRAIKLLGSALIVLVPMSLALWPASDALSVAGKSTGWCSDNSGRNFRCGSGGGGGGGGGAGCATAYQNSDAAISKSNSSGLVTAGNHAWDRGDFANAADLYHSALVENRTTEPHAATTATPSINWVWTATTSGIMTVPSCFLIVPCAMPPPIEEKQRRKISLWHSRECLAV